MQMRQFLLQTIMHNSLADQDLGGTYAKPFKN